MMMATPWDQMPGESSKAFRAFCLYRDLGPARCLDQASRHYHQGRGGAREGTPRGRQPRASGTIRRWAERWNWSARALTWDQELDRVRRTEQMAAVQEMSERHAREAMMLQSKAVESLRLLRPEELKPRDTLNFLVEAAKLERLSRGETTERVAEEHSYTDVKDMTDEELLRIIAASRPSQLSTGHQEAPAKNDGTEELSGVRSPSLGGSQNVE